MSNANRLDESLPQVALFQLLTGAWVSQSIYAACSLRVPDQLGDEPTHVDTLARAVQAHPGALYRILRLLASHGIFSEVAPKIFAHTPRSEALKEDAFGSVRPFALLSGEEHYRAWGEVVRAVQTGAPSFDHLYGEGFYARLARDPVLGARFGEAMTGMAMLANLAVAEAYPIPAEALVVDVGGGQGALLAALLNQAEGAQGVLFDLPTVSAAAPPFLEMSGVAERVRCEGGDFFQAVPAGDILLLARVIQNFSDEEAVAILSNCRRALRPGGKVLIIEMVIPPGDEPFLGKLSDANMLVMTTGRERTEEEYATLFARAGLRLTRCLPTASPASILEGSA